MKQNNAKPRKKDRRRLAAQITAIILTVLLVVGAVYFTIYFTINSIREKKAAKANAAFAVTQTVAALPTPEQF